MVVGRLGVRGKKKDLLSHGICYRTNISIQISYRRRYSLP